MLGNGGNRLGRKSYWETFEAEKEAAARLGIHLNPGECICPRCEGTGRYPVGSDYHKDRCDKCWEAKKLDWIEVAMGKPDPYEGMSVSMSSHSSSSSSSPKFRPLKKSQWEKEFEESSRIFAEELKEWVDQEIINGIIQEARATK